MLFRLLCLFISIALFIPNVVCKKGGTHNNSMKAKACSLAQLGLMVQLTTSRSWGDFSDYGRWCGFGGKGRPVDSIDECCRIHDQCYDDLAPKRCGENPVMTAYIHHYTWTNTDKNHILCTGCCMILLTGIGCKQGSLTSPFHLVSPQSDDHRCSNLACECDKALADCLGKNQQQYNKRWFGLNGGLITRFFLEKVLKP